MVHCQLSVVRDIAAGTQVGRVLAPDVTRNELSAECKHPTYGLLTNN